jgi:phage shock protein PspC (stress-responsive transcriptional regulator)
MNAEDTRTIPPDGDFDPHRLRTISDMRRSTDDRLLGGVCAGAAKYLNIDPIIVRVVIAVLTVAGFAGVILYVAAWFLLPAEDADKSIAAEWFRLDKNEEQIRIVGLLVAAVLAALAIVGDNGYAWWGVPWFLLPLAAIYYLFAVRPRRRREAEAALRGDHLPPTMDPAAEADAGTDPAATKAGLVSRQKIAKSRRDRSWTLTWLTVSLAAIAVAATRIYVEYHDSVPWTTYVAVALGVVALGLLASTLFGNGGPLIGLGALLAIALAIGSVLPSAKIGAQQPVPVTAAMVDAHYTHGIGLLELDLTEVQDPTGLLGRTVELRSGVGQIKVIVPTGLNVEVDAQLDAGEIAVFGRKTNGTDNDLAYPAMGPGPALSLDLRSHLGNIEVIRR